MLLFADNDPHHFGSLHVAMISLFRSATMEVGRLSAFVLVEEKDADEDECVCV